MSSPTKWAHIIKRDASEAWYEIKKDWSNLWTEAKEDFEWLKTDLEKRLAEGKVKMIEFGNAGIDAAEGLVNAIIRGINWCAEKINDIFCLEIPDWVPKYGGERFAANLGQVSEISLPRIPVPALAQGAVLPPNKPFMAWVGDQKQGTNVEAPLSTIEDALRNVMAEQDFNFNINANGPLGAFIRMLKLQIERESDRETAF